MDIIEQLRRDEGERLSAYTDTEGYLTIGIGILIDQRRGGGISKKSSEYLAQEKIDSIVGSLLAHLPWFLSLPEARQCVLVNMAYNLGVEGLLQFHNALTYMQEGRFDAAAAEILDSKWAGQVGDRAKRLAEQLRTGNWV